VLTANPKEVANVEKQKISVKKVLAYKDAVSYIEELARSFGTGTIVVESGEERLVMKPSAQVAVKVEAKAKKDKRKIAFELSWSEATEDDLRIGHAEPESVPAVQPEGGAPAVKPEAKTPAERKPAMAPAKNAEARPPATNAEARPPAKAEDKPEAAAPKKSAPAKSAARKSAARKPTAKKSAAKKGAPKKKAAPKAAAGKTASEKKPAEPAGNK
jgi:amphi-Trp domain-containing protein